MKLDSCPLVGTLAILAVLIGWIFRLALYLGAWTLDAIVALLGGRAALLARLLGAYLARRHRPG